MVWADQNKDGKTKIIFKVHWTSTEMVHNDDDDDDDDGGDSDHDDDYDDDHCETVAYFEREEHFGKSV